MLYLSVKLLEVAVDAPLAERDAPVGGEVGGDARPSGDAAMQRDDIEEKIRASGHSIKRALSDLPKLLRENVLSQTEADALMRVSALIRDAIDVDDFAPSELTGRQSLTIGGHDVTR